MERMKDELCLIIFNDKNVNILDGIRAASLKLTNTFEQLEIRNYDAIEKLFTGALSHKKWRKNDKALLTMQQPRRSANLQKSKTQKKGKRTPRG